MHGGKVALLPQHLNDGRAFKDKVTRENAMWSFMLVFETIIYGSYSILVNLGKENGKLPFKSGSVVILIEFTKLMTSCVMFFPEFAGGGYRLPRIPWMTLTSFSIPAVLYTFNNNIAIHMQLQMDPTTFQVLNNMKIATTALLYKLIIKRAITRPQWIALTLLTLAGVCDSYGGFEENRDPQQMYITRNGLIMVLLTNVFSSFAAVHTEIMLKSQLAELVHFVAKFHTAWLNYGGFVEQKLDHHSYHIFITVKGLVMMFMYCSISGFAAVHTEYLLKKQRSASLPLQNIMLYAYGTFLNGITLLWQMGTYENEDQGFFRGFSVFTWLIVFTQASNGLIMSVVMKHGSNLTRLFIISGGMLTSTILSMFVFGTIIDMFFVIAAVLVIMAIYLYHH